MRIKYTGIYEIPEGEEPDDRGSIDVWILNEIEAALRDCETDEVYERLNLRWEIIKES